MLGTLEALIRLHEIAVHDAEGTAGARAEAERVIRSFAVGASDVMSVSPRDTALLNADAGRDPKAISMRPSSRPDASG